MSKWVDFRELQPTDKRITRIVAVQTKGGGEELGVIKWFGRWRQYCFYPDWDTIYNAECMYDIGFYMQAMMAARKEAKT